jgi:hypothetical protein
LTETVKSAVYVAAASDVKMAHDGSKMMMLAIEIIVIAGLNACGN